MAGTNVILLSLDWPATTLGIRLVFDAMARMYYNVLYNPLINQLEQRIALNSR